MLDVQYPDIDGFVINEGLFYKSSNRSEGKFVIFAQEEKVKLYGLLWGPHGSDDFDLSRVRYEDVPHWAYKAHSQISVLKRSWERFFDVNHIRLGGGYLTNDGGDLRITALQDRLFPAPPKEIVEACLKKSPTAGCDNIEVIFGERADITYMDHRHNKNAQEWYKSHGFEFRDKSNSDRLPYLGTDKGRSSKSA
jgi:hypothetical protein